MVVDHSLLFLGAHLIVAATECLGRDLLLLHLGRTQNFQGLFRLLPHQKVLMVKQEEVRGAITCFAFMNITILGGPPPPPLRSHLPPPPPPTRSLPPTPGSGRGDPPPPPDRSQP